MAEVTCKHCGKRSSKHYCYFGSPEETTFDPDATADPFAQRRIPADEVSQGPASAETHE